MNKPTNQKRSRSKKLKIPVPREHGAWGILLGAFFSAIAFSNSIEIAQVLFIFSMVLFYFSRQSVLMILRGKSGRPEKIWFAVFGGLGWIFLLSAAVVSSFWPIIFWSLSLSVFLFIELLLIRARKQMSFLAQLIGTIGLTTAAPLTLLLHTQSITFSVLFIWLINILFFVSGILFVRYQITLMKKQPRENPDFSKYHFAMILYHLSLLLLLVLLAMRHDLYSGLIVAFIPALLQAFISVFAKIQVQNLKLIGWLEIGQTIFFVLFLFIWI